jgi:MFS family permease
MQGPHSALFTELFPTRVRYTGVSVVYQLSSLGAGLTPVAFAAIVSVTGVGNTWLVSTLLAGAALLSLVCPLALPETVQTSLRDVERVTDQPTGGQRAAKIWTTQ